MGNQTYFVTDRDLRWQLVQEAHQDRTQLVDNRLQLQQLEEDRSKRFGGLIVKEKSGTNTPQFLLQMNYSHEREEILDVVEKYYRSPIELQQ